MKPDEVRVIFERVAYRMILAGWLKGYCFTAGVGHSISWKSEGVQRALLLKDLSEKFALADDDESPLRFHRACKGLLLPPDIGFPFIDSEVSPFWLQCVQELGLGDDGDGLLGMIHIVTSWGPIADSAPPA